MNRAFMLLALVAAATAGAETEPRSLPPPEPEPEPKPEPPKPPPTVEEVAARVCRDIEYRERVAAERRRAAELATEREAEKARRIRAEIDATPKGRKAAEKRERRRQRNLKRAGGTP